MRTMNGGYAMINLASATIHADALAALASNKPIVVYEATGAPYYADSVTTSGTNIIITKGGKTITIANDNTITNVGDIKPKLHFYSVIINGTYNNDDLSCEMLITSLDTIKKGEITYKDINVINILNKYCFTPMYEQNDNLSYLPVFEDIYIDDDNNLQGNFYEVGNGEQSFDTITSITIIENE